MTKTSLVFGNGLSNQERAVAGVLSHCVMSPAPQICIHHPLGKLAGQTEPSDHGEIPK